MRVIEVSQLFYSLIGESAYHRDRRVMVRIHVEEQYSGMEQLVARQAHNLKVAGSSPALATKSFDLILSET